MTLKKNHQPKLYMTVGRDTQDRLLAIISTGDNPKAKNAKITVLDVKHVENEDEAKIWFAESKINRPWETRQ